MALKRLLVLMTGVTDESPVLSTALAIAKAVGAHVDALFVPLDPQLAIASGDYISPEVLEKIINDTKHENERRQRRTKALFERLAHKHGVAIKGLPGTNKPSAALVEASGPEHLLMVNHGRLCDLIVMERLDKQEDRAYVGIEAALRDSGRPVLITRRAMPAGFAKSVAVAWNGSLEVTRTVGFAMPLLERAEKVVIFTLEGDSWYGPPAAKLIEYLAWHGIPAVAVSLTPSWHGQGKALLSAAKKHKIDLMMLGAYTRGELRRLVFGGVTGAMLADCPLPLLMMH
jgi:nucleotide-binding universal stress UspA family protein